MINIDIFDKRSLTLVSKKVATISGDIRRSLQITKRAVEMCRENYLKTGEEVKVDITTVIEAYDEMQNSKIV